MLRVTLIHLGLFLLPFAAYVLWVVIRDRISAKKALREGPKFWLGVAGLSMVFASLMITATFQEAPSGTNYKPSEYRDGVLIEGGYDNQTDQ